MTHNRDPQPTAHQNDAQIIDLPTVVAPVQKLVQWFDDLLADNDPPIGGLDAAVKELQALPDIPGRLGRDITLIAGGGVGAQRSEVIAALNRLRQVAAMNPPSAPATHTHPAASRPRRPRRKQQPSQATLPGLASN